MDELVNIIESFYENKKQLDYFKTKTDSENKQIKQLMNDKNIDNLTTENGITAKLTKSNRETFNEPALIEKLIESDITKEAVKLVPQIDFDVLEDLIYNGKLDASELTPYKEIKVVETLKVTMKKGE